MSKQEKWILVDPLARDDAPAHIATITITVDMGSASDDDLEALDLAIHNIDSIDVVTVQGWGDDK